MAARVTLVCGVSGSGKTTLVGSMLQACSGLRMCVIVDSVVPLELADAGKVCIWVDRDPPLDSAIESKAYARQLK